MFGFDIIIRLGMQGFQGLKGQKGELGFQGPDGPQGEQGKYSINANMIKTSISRTIA